MERHGEKRATLRRQACSYSEGRGAQTEGGGRKGGRAGGGESTVEDVIGSNAIPRLVEVFRGEVGRTGIPDDIDPPVRPQADSIPIIGADPPEIGGIREARSGGGEYTYKSVINSTRSRLVWVLRGKVGRTGFPGDIDFSVRPQADSIPEITATPPPSRWNRRGPIRWRRGRSRSRQNFRHNLLGMSFPWGSYKIGFPR